MLTICNNKKIISIIVPCYCVEKYLPRCVDSILNQTYRCIEIFLIDDGSPDRCGEISDEYASIDNRVKVIHKNNEGLSNARNTAINLAKGEYIAFVDSDDYIAPNYIETLYNLVEKYNCKISVVNPIAIDEKGNKIHLYKPDNKEYVWTSNEAVEHMFYQKKLDTSAWGKLYHRSLFEIGIRFPSGLLFEDLPVIYKLFYAGDNVVLLNTELYYYQIRANSIEGTVFSSEKMNSVFKIFQLFEQNKILLKNVEKAFNCRILCFILHLLLKMPSNYKYNDLLYDKIKNIRFGVMFNPKARMKARIACFLSYFGLNVLKKFFILIDNRKS